MKKIIFLLIILLCTFSYSQKKFDSYIFLNSNLASLDSLDKELYDFELLNKINVSNFLKKNPNFRSIYFKNDNKKELVNIIDGIPIYNTTYNFNSAKTIFADRLYSDGGLGLNLNGAGLYAGVWDGGSARFSHSQFNNRVSIIDDSVVDNHATHVTGTIIASGVGNLNIRGIAYNASVYSYDWSNDLTEMSSAFQNFNLLVSNHSYGADADTAPLWLFGGYDNKARLMDSLLFNSQFLLPIVAAGNDRDNFQQYNPSKNGFDLIGGFNSAKNVITVGAINQVLNYVSPNSVVMSAFSNWGPTDDGRIKPDVVAKGVNVRSTTSASDSSNGFLSGTSMASPAVAGACLLLQQHYSNLYQNPMLASTLKGLILHTAEEAGSSKGPDYMFGWGLVNSEKAARLITDKGTASIIDELTLQNNAAYSTEVQINNSSSLMASISWTDRPPLSANSGTVDLQTKMLVNDLDIRILKDGEIFYPWTLDPSNPSFSASNLTDNSRDNFEKIEIENANGIYNILVTHKGNLSGGQQKFSLIVSGSGLTRLNSDIPNLKNMFTLYPNPAKNTLNVNINTIYNNATLSIVDLQGRLIKSQSLLDTTTTIDVANLQSGVYIVKVDSSDGSYTKKFIKE